RIDLSDFTAFAEREFSLWKNGGLPFWSKTKILSSHGGRRRGFGYFLSRMAEYSESSGSNFRLGEEMMDAKELITLNNEKHELLNEENEIYYYNILIYKLNRYLCENLIYYNRTLVLIYINKIRKR